jgi:hypothetical protein
MSVPQVITFSRTGQKMVYGVGLQVLYWCATRNIKFTLICTFERSGEIGSDPSSFDKVLAENAL